MTLNGMLSFALKAGWPPALVFAVHVVTGQMVNVYALFPRFDVLMHFAGGLAMAHFFRCSFAALPEGAIVSSMRGAMELVIVISLTTTAAVFWEFAEFSMDAVFGHHAQLGLEDTMRDMAVGVFGGAVYAGAAKLRRAIDWVSNP